MSSGPFSWKLGKTSETVRLARSEICQSVLVGRATSTSAHCHCWGRYGPGSTWSRTLETMKTSSRGNYEGRRPNGSARLRSNAMSRGVWGYRSGSVWAKMHIVGEQWSIWGDMEPLKSEFLSIFLFEAPRIFSVKGKGEGRQAKNTVGGSFSELPVEPDGACSGDTAGATHDEMGQLVFRTV